MFWKIVRVLTALFIIVAGAVKLFPVESFEYLLVKKGISSWELSPFIARLIVGFEFLLGLILLIPYKLKKVSLPSNITVIGIYTLYIIITLLVNGNEENCGCFGSILPLNSWETLLKNLVLLAILIGLYKKHSDIDYSKRVNLILIPCLVLSIVLPFILRFSPSGETNSVKVGEKVDLESLPALLPTGDEVSYEDGKHIVAFLSVSCSHCKNVALKLKTVSEMHNIQPITFVLGGKKDKLPAFLEETNTQFPYHYISNGSFYSYVGGNVPATCYVNNGVLENIWYGDNFDVDEFVTVCSKN